MSLSGAAPDEPPEPPAYPEAVAAILDADLVILGPGSLYTSVLPNLLVPDIASALAATPAPVVYVANVATQPGETDGYSLDDHVEALEKHLGRQVVDMVDRMLWDLASRHAKLPIYKLLGAAREQYLNVIDMAWNNPDKQAEAEERPRDQVPHEVPVVTHDLVQFPREPAPGLARPPFVERDLLSE